MLKRLFAATAFVVVCASTTPRPIAAQVLFDNYCVTNFNVCASVRVFASGNTLTMQVWNLNGVMGVSHTMTSVGVYHLGSTYDWTGSITGFSARYVTATSSTNISQYWQPKFAKD